MNLNVSLTEELMRFVKSKVDSGRYTSASEVVREALRLLERQDSQEAEKLRGLQQAWKDGIESGGSRLVAELQASPLKDLAVERTSFKAPVRDTSL
ncbi:type II toxin-antitoxin system ParD family antitoxin [Pleomorphomonas sp. PLEO]|uniref:type II toxin-antitoxin system ParD family antitoxin n=1 Tax=Pleomorphomonas sp. PLEO TaxID=3239306 RepID=UPI00351EDF85